MGASVSALVAVIRELITQVTRLEEQLPAPRAFYDARRGIGDTHNRALRALANRLVGILHSCLRHNCPYNENLASGHRQQQVA